MNLLRLCHTTSEEIFAPVVRLTAARFASNLHVPPYFLEQLFTIEDKRFLIHPGVDPIAVVRAGLENLGGKGRLQGASTITQQLYDARRELKGFRRSRTVTRKILQTGWALLEELHRSKCNILGEYLNIVYWGRSYYGIDAAARSYFHSDRDSITLTQSFFLAERLARPNSISITRIRSLLSRASISKLFLEDKSAFEELVAIYDKRFHCGGELWQCLVKSPKKLEGPMSKSWSGALNVP